MDNPFSTLIDRAFAQAERDGAFKDLPGAGKPLDLGGGTAAEAVLNRLMTESKVKPQAVVLRERIVDAQARLKSATDEGERRAVMKELADLQTRFGLEMEALRRYG